MERQARNVLYNYDALAGVVERHREMVLHGKPAPPDVVTARTGAGDPTGSRALLLAGSGRMREVIAAVQAAREAANALPPLQRKAARMRYREGRTVHDCAAACGVSRRTVCAWDGRLVREVARGLARARVVLWE
jgi:DNA-directed RNA polymerase specialized sigma24 family protein